MTLEQDMVTDISCSRVHNLFKLASNHPDAPVSVQAGPNCPSNILRVANDPTIPVDHEIMTLEQDMATDISCSTFHNLFKLASHHPDTSVSVQGGPYCPSNILQFANDTPIPVDHKIMTLEQDMATDISCLTVHNLCKLASHHADALVSVQGGPFCPSNILQVTYDPPISWIIRL